MSRVRRGRGVVMLLAVLLLVLFLIRPSVRGLQKRIANSISSALGRRVQISSASLRFLPQPGFDLENFIVYDDPAVSLEPMLRSDQVTASLRIMPLLRGRLEISRLSLTDPSLNLVRTSTGHWNLEYLLERSARLTAAPTGKPANEPRPAFPYVEASGARINFKFGMEKKQFALTEADFALFQDSENSWGVRLEAKPVRTDSNFSDTGLLKISGSWQRAASLRDTPLRFSAQWDQTQLGQASKLIYGNDKGWRGTGSISAELSGTPGNLVIITEASVQDFRRYDILSARPVGLRMQCGGSYSSATQTLSNIICASPVGNGALTLHGSMTVSRSPEFHLALFSQDVPLQSLIALARHSKKDIPSDLVATGTVDGSVKVQRDGSNPVSWEGVWDTSEFRLGSQIATAQIALPKIHFAVSSGTPNVAVISKEGKKRRRMTLESSKLAQPGPQETRVQITPFGVALGGTLPAVIGGWFSRTGYSLTLDGDAQLRRLLRSARSLGIPAPQPDADGSVKFQFQIADTWAGFKAARVTGSAELDSVTAHVVGLSAPIEIDSAKILLGPDTVNVEELSASLGGTSWHGSLILPRPCGVMGTCAIHMNLHAGEITTDDLADIFKPVNNAPWYEFLMKSQRSYLLTLHASGQLSADLLLLRKLPATHFSAAFELDRGKVRLTNMQASIFGGSHSGEWTIDFAARPPAYNVAGNFQRVALAQLAASMHDNWISGTAAATYNVTASGSSAAEILASATGLLKIDARDGMLPHIVLTNFAGPLRLHRFEGNLLLQHREFEFDGSRLEANGGSYRLTGTASLGRNLNLILDRNGSRRLTITGTVADPVISTGAISQTQAALKR